MTNINQTKPDTEFDTPWKEIIETYFEDFIRFFLPEAYEKIDWTRPPEFVDKELNRVVRDAKLGTRYADKLVKVWYKDGAVKWIVIHIEVQSQDEKEFAERMYVYHTRIYNRFRCRVVRKSDSGR